MRRVWEGFWRQINECHLSISRLTFHPRFQNKVNSSEPLPTKVFLMQFPISAEHTAIYYQATHSLKSFSLRPPTSRHSPHPPSHGCNFYTIRTPPSISSTTTLTQALASLLWAAATPFQAGRGCSSLSCVRSIRLRQSNPTIKILNASSSYDFFLRIMISIKFGLKYFSKIYLNGNWGWRAGWYKCPHLRKEGSGSTSQRGPK